MFKDTHAFSGFSVNDIATAKKFYGETLGLDVEEDPMGLALNIAGGSSIYVYQKDNHEPASFTILNFPVDDIDKAIDELTSKGIQFEHYDNLGFKQDEKGVARGLSANMGPDIAWFKDPAGNVLAILQQK
jgi:catechol 2,3-dioxygenase-like lactoylglutathione lyase family enzyme